MRPTHEQKAGAEGTLKECSSRSEDIRLLNVCVNIHILGVCVNPQSPQELSQCSPVLNTSE